LAALIASVIGSDGQIVDPMVVRAGQSGVRKPVPVAVRCAAMRDGPRALYIYV
jgi:hypothetical protein